jgi:hypothetical protein
MFQLESQLVGKLEDILVDTDNPFSELAIAFEFDYQAGRVDVIATNTNGELFAFEAKLSRWRGAVNQAYRNTSFTHYSYVVLPMLVARNALKFRYEFERRGIGLCSVGLEGIVIEIPASRRTPLQPWLTNSAMEYIKEEMLQSSVVGGKCCLLPPHPLTSPLLTN